MAMMAMTTSNSISVKPLRQRIGGASQKWKGDEHPDIFRRLGRKASKKNERFW
jgi:hypothetical protein